MIRRKDLSLFSKDTPEYIHPRNCNDAQWLMSPPAIDGDLCAFPVNNSSSMNADESLLPVRKRLLRPDDLTVADNITSVKLKETAPQCVCDAQKFHLWNMLHGFVCQSIFSQAQLRSSDSEKCTAKTLQNCMNSFESKDKCKQFSDVLQHMELSHNFCNSLLCVLASMSLCTFHECHQLLLQKLFPTGDANTLQNSVAKPHPIGVFWDIENCQVPTGKSAFDIVQKIRAELFADHYEAEFIAVCDINKETKQVVQDLNDAQVDVIHVNAMAKNAADDKLRQSIRRYAHAQHSPAAAIVITGDCNFASEVSDLRHRHNFFVVLLHHSNSNDSFKQTAHLSLIYEDFVKDLPVIHSSTNELSSKYNVLISKLPIHKHISAIRSKLKQISFNCGGRILQVSPPHAIMRFNSSELAARAVKRMNGEDIFGSKIVVELKKTFVKNFSSHQKGSSKFCEDVLHCKKKHSSRNTLQNNFELQTPKNSSSIHDGSMINVPKNEDKVDQIEVSSPISLTISNIDAQLGEQKIKEIVESMVSEYCSLLHSQIRPHNRFTVVCDILVADKKGALSVLVGLHRKRIGKKRILITVTPISYTPTELLRNEVLPLMSKTNESGIPFYKLAVDYQLKYHKPLKVCYLYSITDIVTLEKRINGLMVFLKRNGEKKASFVCSAHQVTKLACDLRVDISLCEFSAKLHMLLLSHGGVLFLDGFEQCYAAEYSFFPHAKSPCTGVPLEHVLSYVPGVIIMKGKVKAIVWSPPLIDAGPPSEPARTSVEISSYTKQFVEYMKTLPCGSISLADLMHRFNYPYSIDELVGSLTVTPHVLQLIGSDDNRYVVLSHRTQVKRFTQELIKILKASPDRSVKMSSFPSIYTANTGRPWKEHSYGVSSIVDLLDDIPDGIICVTDDGDDVILSLPKRERSSEEIMRTSQFSWELIEMLKQWPRFRIAFKDFIPVYHRFFGHQCKLSKFGFTKLLDLFESLPHIVQVVDDVTERYLQLTKEVRMKILTSQILPIIHGTLCDVDGGVPLARLQSIYARIYDRPLIPRDYNCDDIEELVGSLAHSFKLLQSDRGPVIVTQCGRKPARLLATQLLVLLLDIDDHRITLAHLHQAYIDRYGEGIVSREFGYSSLDALVGKALSGIAKVEVEDDCHHIALQPVYERARRVRNILLQHDGSMTLGEFNRCYRETYSRPLDADTFGFPSCESMLRALPQVLTLKGFGIKKKLVLRNHMLHGPLSASVVSTHQASSKHSNRFSLLPSSVSPPPSSTNLLRLSDISNVYIDTKQCIFPSISSPPLQRVNITSPKSTLPFRSRLAARFCPPAVCGLPHPPH